MTLVNKEYVNSKILRHLGRNDSSAIHALVFMVRGIKKKYKQVVAYDSTRDAIKTPSLKQIIVEVIKQLHLSIWSEALPQMRDWKNRNLKTRELHQSLNFLKDSKLPSNQLNSCAKI